MARKRKNENKNTVLIIVAVFLVVLFLFFVVLELTQPSGEEKIMQQEGYETTEEDAFYKKIVTNNTLDDYYDDVANNIDSAYEEYYLAKESYNFIELKMTYQNEVSKTINITSDIRTNIVTFNYELSYKTIHLLLEGSSVSDYACNVVVKKSVNDEELQNACDEVQEEINTFLSRQNELLSNKNVQDIVNQPIKEYVEED